MQHSHRRGLLLLLTLLASLCTAVSAHASSLPLAGLSQTGMWQRCSSLTPYQNMQQTDATPPATTSSVCGMSANSSSGGHLISLWAAPGYGNVVVSVDDYPSQHATSLALTVNNVQVGDQIALQLGVRGWTSFPSVAVHPGDQVRVTATFAGSTTTTTIATVHAEYTEDVLALAHADITQPGDSQPHGVPTSFSWYAQGVVTNAADSNNWYAGNPWGQVYAVASGNSPLGPNGEPLYVDLRNQYAWVLSKSTNQWIPLYKNADGAARPDKLGGALYPEDFSGSPIAGNVTRNADGSETVAPKPADEATVTAKGYLFHFYPGESRAGVPGATLGGTSTDVAAVCSTAEVRLDPSNVATSYAPGLIANVGFDWWEFFGGGPANGAGESRFKTVTTSWRLLTFCTLSGDQWTTAPPLPLTVDASELF